MTKIGYIVPEFPGQTHIFFWREIKRLEEMGVDVQIVSTRKPPSVIRSHSWSDEAEQRTTYLAQGGKASTASSLASAAARSNIRAIIKCLRSVARTKVSASERVKLLALILVGAKLSRIAKEGRWDHMHVHSCADAANITTFASMLSGVPYSLTLHGPLSDYGPNQNEKWGSAAFGIVITHKLLAEIESELGPAIAKKTVIAPMGVDLDTFKRQSVYRPWDGQGLARLYSVGRLNPCKGHDDLIRAVGLLTQRGIPVHLTIAGQDEQGGGGYQQTLRKLIRELDLQDRVEMVGAVSEVAIRNGLLSSHVFALASLHEPLGVAIMEAMALEMPVVVTSAGGVAELVDHQEDGFLVEAGNPAEMANAIAEVLTDSALAERLAAASREKIRKGFQDTVSADTLMRHAF